MSKYLQIAKPKTALEQIESFLIPDSIEKYKEAFLVIKINDGNLQIDELSAFLKFIDKAYGRLRKEGILSYSRSADKLKIKRVETGSLEILIDLFSVNVNEIINLVIIYYLIKYLPSSMDNFARAFESYQNAMLTRARRKELRLKIKEDEYASKLNKYQFNKLIEYLDYLYKSDLRLLPRSKKFVIKYLISIFFRFKKEDDDNEE